MTRSAPSPLMLHLALSATMVFWGVSFVASRYVLGVLTPFTYMGIRFALAGVLFAIVSAVRGIPRLSRRSHLLIAATALAEPVAYFIFESYGIRLVSATTASLVIATVPIVVMVFARLALGEPMSRRGVVSAIVSMVGIGLLVLGRGTLGGVEAARTAGLGVLLILGAVISAAAYITLARSITQSEHPVVVTTFQTWWGTGVFMALWLTQPPAERSLAGVDPTGWVALAFLAGAATVGAFLLYNWALSHTTAGKAALYINAIPVVTAITGRLLLDERLAPLQWLGAALVLGAVALVQRQPRRPAPVT